MPYDINDATQRDGNRTPPETWGGFISKAANEFTGGINALVLTEGQGGSVDDGGKYTVLCNEHGTCIQTNNKTMGQWLSKHSEEFCDGCRELQTQPKWIVHVRERGKAKPVFLHAESLEAAKKAAHQLKIDGHIQGWPKVPAFKEGDQWYDIRIAWVGSFRFPGKSVEDVQRQVFEQGFVHHGAKLSKKQ